MKNELIKVARIHDPAFAGATLDAVKKYAASRDEADMPPSAPGTTPVVFHFRRLSRSEMLDYVGAVDSDEQRFARSFLAGVVRVTGGRFGAGVEFPGAMAKTKIAMSEDELDECGFATADMREVGHVIYARSDCPFDCAPRYRLLPTSLDVWAGNARRYVAQNPPAARQSNDKPKDE